MSRGEGEDALGARIAVRNEARGDMPGPASVAMWSTWVQSPSGTRTT